MSVLRPLRGFLFEPRSTAPMTLVRVGWGTVTALWALTLLPDVDPFLTTGALRYGGPSPAGSWNLLGWTSWTAAPVAACVLLVVASVATAVGFRTRLSAVVAVLCLVSLQRTNTTILNSGDLFLRQIGIAVALSPCGLRWSIDAARRRRRGDLSPAPWRAPWGQRLLQLQLALGYLLSAWTKLRGHTWRDGSALGLALRIEDLQRVAAPDWLLARHDLLTALTWGTLAFEASFCVLVWNRRLRPQVLAVGALLHLGIDVFLDVGFFSIAIWLAYLAFVPPEVADRVLRRVDPAGVGSAERDVAPVVLTVEPAE